MPACSGELRIAPLRDKTRDSGKGKKDTKGRISGGGGGSGRKGGRKGGRGRTGAWEEAGGAKEKRRLSLCPPGCYLLKKDKIVTVSSWLLPLKKKERERERDKVAI